MTTPELQAEYEDCMAFSGLPVAAVVLQVASLATSSTAAVLGPVLSKSLAVTDVAALHDDTNQTAALLAPASPVSR